MDVLGYSIDPTFIYFVSPIDATYIGSDGYYVAFTISFKDGRDHVVRIKNNVSIATGTSTGIKMWMSCKDLSGRERRKLNADYKKDLKNLTILRSNIISLMSA